MSIIGLHLKMQNHAWISHCKAVLPYWVFMTLWRVNGIWFWYRWPNLVGIISSLPSCGPWSTCQKKTILLWLLNLHLKCWLSDYFSLRAVTESHPCDCPYDAVNYSSVMPASLLPDETPSCHDWEEMGEISCKTVLHPSTKCPRTSLALS